MRHIYLAIRHRSTVTVRPSPPAVPPRISSFNTPTLPPPDPDLYEPVGFTTATEESGPSADETDNDATCPSKKGEVA